MSVTSKPSRASSQAVSRAPCRTGRVSHATTRTCLPAARAARTTPSAVPQPPVASAPALQCVRTVAPSGTRCAPILPIAQHAATSSRWISRASPASRATRAAAPRLSTSRTTRAMRSIAHARLTAVGRVARRRSCAARIAVRNAERAPGLGCSREDEPVRGGDPDGRGAANGQRLDRFGDLLEPIEPHVSLLQRQRALIEELDIAIARHQLDGRVGCAAQGSRMRQRHEGEPLGSPPRDRAMRAAISSVAVPSSSKAFSLSPCR